MDDGRADAGRVDRCRRTVRAGIESCGILCGRVRHGVFHVTTLVIPKQKGGSDQVQVCAPGCVDGVLFCCVTVLRVCVAVFG